MKEFEIQQKIKFILLTVLVAGSFFYTFKKRSETFFSNHPVYRSLLKNHHSFFQKEQKEQVLAVKEIFPYKKQIIEDLGKINAKRSFFNESEMKIIKESLVQIEKPQFNPITETQKVDVFTNFRGTWKGKDESILVSRDGIKESEEKKLNLQYVEFRGPGGASVYGLNSVLPGKNVIFSEVRTPNYKKIFKRIGVLVNKTKIVWMTQVFGDKDQFRISIDEIIDGFLNVKSVDIDFQAKIKKIDKVNFSTHQFSKLIIK